MLRSPEPLADGGARYLAASFTAEAVDHFVKTGERDDALWSLLESWYADLSILPEDRLGGRLAAFTLRLMAHLGYRPKLEECLECGRNLRYDPARFLPVAGAAACLSCPLDERALAGAVPLASSERAEIASCLDGLNAPLSTPAVRAAALSLLEAHLDRPLSSLPLVRAALPSGRAILAART
jgi:recombinational DNA repair protein (RecF pathway)